MAQEKIFENKVKSFLDGKSYTIKHFGNGFTKSGVPDLLCCINGYYVGVEIKAANGKPSELQLYNLRLIHGNGGYGILLYPNDFDTFKAFVKALNDNDKELTEIYYQQLKRRWI